MPAGNGMGPMGWGPMTGRGAGFCAGFNMPGYGAGRGRGFQRGVGRRMAGAWGRGARFGAVFSGEAVGPTPEQELETLKTARENIEREIRILEKEMGRSGENPEEN